MSIELYNVLTNRKETFEPVEQGALNIYVCGVTVYGRCHVGHLRCYLSFDAILRYFAYRGYRVRYARNFTDIDDKIIKRAAEISAGPEGAWREEDAYASYSEEQWRERLDEDRRILERAEGQDRHLAEIVADHFIDVFRHEDFGPFDLLQPDFEPRVSDKIPEVIALIDKILARGLAYEVDGEVYFDVPAYHEATGAYGKLSGRDYRQLEEGARVAPTESKRHAVDFALWKRSAPGEPVWPSPWGDGRPGWHIECSAMSIDALGQPFDIHGGGKDLIFPHHENEIAQAEGGTGETYCNAWMHNGFVTVDGVKMSKSLGNFISIRDALEIAPPEVWRLLVLGTHYANPIDFSRTHESGDEQCETVRGSIEIAFDRLEYFYETLQRAGRALSDVEVDSSAELLDDRRARGIVDRFCEAMDDDFNTARALADLGESMRCVNDLCDMRAKQIKKLPGGRAAWAATLASALGEIREVCGVMHLCDREPAAALEDLHDFSCACKGLDKSEVNELVARRTEARARKDWELSDRIRDELAERGVELRDGPGGTTWKVCR
ncbi:MAG: cysteine--tRNA ligase [Polyangia bacterium]